MQSTFIVFLGAGIGGMLRHLLNAWICAIAGTAFPWGILVINVLGSTAMGLIAGWFAFRGQHLHDVRLLLTTGVLGGFTTFSAFSLDTTLLIERGESVLAAGYVAASVALAIIGLFVGLWIMRTIFA